MRMYSTLKFDRKIDANRHYISPGGYEISCKDGRNIAFDFEDFEGSIVEEDATILETMQKNLDISTFPDAAKLNDVLKNGLFDKFVEFFVYTGEYDDPEIRLKKVLGICFELDDGSRFELSDAKIRQVNALIKNGQ